MVFILLKDYKKYQKKSILRQMKSICNSNFRVHKQSLMGTQLCPFTGYCVGLLPSHNTIEKWQLQYTAYKAKEVNYLANKVNYLSGSLHKRFANSCLERKAERERESEPPIHTLTGGPTTQPSANPCLTSPTNPETRLHINRKPARKMQLLMKFFTFCARLPSLKTQQKWHNVQKVPQKSFQVCRPGSQDGA